MAEVQKVGSLEVDQDIAFTLSEWATSRAGWVIFALTLAAAAAGLFGGSGPLAVTDTSSSDSKLQVQYSAITRLAGTPQFTVKADSSLATGDTLTLGLSTKLIETMKVER